MGIKKVSCFFPVYLSPYEENQKGCSSDQPLLCPKGALFQSGVWSRCLETIQNLPSPKDFGWIETEDDAVKWTPNWMTQFEASKECREFVKCGCKTSCIGSKKCKCNSVDLKCTRLCTCKCSFVVSYD